MGPVHVEIAMSARSQICQQLATNHRHVQAHIDYILIGHMICELSG